MEIGAVGTKRVPAVKLVRGPFLYLPPHPDFQDNESGLRQLVHRLRARDDHQMIAADLFCGAGGLSLGLEQAGFNVVFAADHDADSVETHRHHFPGLTVDWDLADPDVVAHIGGILRDLDLDLLAGGPPCQPFSKAGRSVIRHHVRNGLREPHDRRRDLWRGYLEIVRLSRPRAVIMENVPDMALDREMFILRTMVFELEQMGYSVAERVVDAHRYGVPQFRQRLILVALRDGVAFSWPAETTLKTTVDTAIGDLPAVEGGWRPSGGAAGWTPYEEPRTRFQAEMRAGMHREDAHKVFDHITRPVRSDDAEAFALMDTTTRYSELPQQFKRYRDDIFDDKYKRLNPHDLSRTITAHIAKDGYWYIHPFQERTLTVREAARLQTFPDQIRFAGAPSSAFRQIGNAVPPRLGRVLGEAVIASLNEGQPQRVSSEQLATCLATWKGRQPASAVPWLDAETRWQVIAAEMLLERAVVEHARHIWPLLARWRTPRETLSAADDLGEIGQWLNRRKRAEDLLQLAALLDRDDHDLGDDDLAGLVSARLISRAHADLAALVVAVGAEDSSEEPVVVTKGALRAAMRLTGAEGSLERNKLTDGRLAVARAIGFGAGSRRAHIALMELSALTCHPDPQCGLCPLLTDCPSGKAPDGG